VGIWGDQQPHFLFWDPLHISETNPARKLKFGTLAGIYRHYGSITGSTVVRPMQKSVRKSKTRYPVK